jgi:hypothetical protein
MQQLRQMTSPDLYLPFHQKIASDDYWNHPPTIRQEAPRPQGWSRILDAGQSGAALVDKINNCYESLAGASVVSLVEPGLLAALDVYDTLLKIVEDVRVVKAKKPRKASGYMSNDDFDEAAQAMVDTVFYTGRSELHTQVVKPDGTTVGVTRIAAYLMRSNGGRQLVSMASEDLGKSYRNGTHGTRLRLPMAVGAITLNRTKDIEDQAMVVYAARIAPHVGQRYAVPARSAVSAFSPRTTTSPA